MSAILSQTAIDIAIEDLTAELLAALPKYRDAKARFATYDRMNTVRLPQPESGRAYRKRAFAIGDCSWLQSDIQTIAAALVALTQVGAQ